MRPVDADAVLGVDAEIRRMKARREGRPMHRAAADAFAAVVFAEGQRMLAAGDPQIGPVQFVRALFVADPVTLGIPERASLETDHPEARPRQALQQYAAGRADADDAVVHFIRVSETLHLAADALQRAQAMAIRFRRFERAE